VVLVLPDHLINGWSVPKGVLVLLLMLLHYCYDVHQELGNEPEENETVEVWECEDEDELDFPLTEAPIIK
jgi:hypothetical protein